MNAVQPASSEQLLSRSQAAEFLGVAEQTLAIWASTKRYALPFIRVGRLCKYRRADLEVWLQSRRVCSSAN